MAYTILERLSTMAQNIDSINVNFIDKDNDIENGAVIQRGALSTDADKREVYDVTTPTSAKDIWMVFTAGSVVIETASGNKYYFDDLDPRDYVNRKGKVLNAFKLQKEDKIKISPDGISGTKGTNTYVVAQPGSRKLVWASAPVDGASFELIEESYFSIPTGKFGSQRTVGYKFQCVAV